MKAFPALTACDRKLWDSWIERMALPNSEEHWAQWLYQTPIELIFGLHSEDDAEIFDGYQQYDCPRFANMWIAVGNRNPQMYQYGGNPARTHSLERSTLWVRDDRNEFHQQMVEQMEQIAHGCRIDDASTMRRVFAEKHLTAVRKLLTAKLTHHQNDLDSDPWLLGCPHGIVDLKTGNWHSRHVISRDDERTSERLAPDHYVTKCTGFDPDPHMPIPRWLEFLDQVTQGDADLIAFLRRYLGYSLTGDAGEQTLIYLYGPGGNGKGVLQNVWSRIMGDYAVAANEGLLEQKRFAGHPTEMARLHGARLVTASETNAGSRWNEARLKGFTGSDTVSAHFMHRDFFEFRPEFKLMVLGNTLPQLSAVDESIERRFRIVPFKHKPPKPNRNLEAELIAEGPGILQWAIMGLADWHRNGLGTAACINAATAEYLESENNLARWIDEECSVAPNATSKPGDLWASWAAWCDDQKVRSGTRNQWGRDLTKAGYPSNGKKGTSVRRLGIALAAENTMEGLS